MSTNTEQGKKGAGPGDLISSVLGTPPAPVAVPVQPSTPPEVGGQPAQPPVVSGNPPATPPQQPQQPDLSALLAEATGGKVKSIDELNAFYEAAAQAEQLKNRAAELEAKVNQAPKFASDFVQKLNDLVASGADHAKINSWWSLANTDISGMQPLDVLVLQKQMENPGMSKDMLTAYVLAEYGIETDGDTPPDIASLPAAKAAKLQIDANAARKAINDQKASIETVTPNAPGHDPAVEQMRQVEAESAKNFWGQVLGALPAQIPFSFEDADKGIPKYEFNYTPKPEVVAAAKEQLLEAIAQNPGMFTKDKDGALQLQETFQSLIQVNSIEDYRRAMFMDLYGSAMQMAVKRNGGTVPTDSHAAPPVERTDPNKKPPITDIISAIKANQKR